MSQKHHACVATIVLSVFLATATPSAHATTTAAAMIYQGMQCGDREPGLRVWSPSDRADPQNPPAAALTPPRGKRLYVLSQGERPTAGYGVSLARRRATVANHHIRVRVHWQEPPPGNLQAQVMTRPCLVFALPDRAYRSVTVTDEAGRVRARLTRR